MTQWYVIERYSQYGINMLPVMPFFLFNEPSDAQLKMQELMKKEPQYKYNLRIVFIQ